MPSFTLPPNLERALRKEKDEIEFHIDKYSTCLAKIDVRLRSSSKPSLNWPSNSPGLRSM